MAREKIKHTRRTKKNGTTEIVKYDKESWVSGGIKKISNAKSKPLIKLKMRYRRARFFGCMQIGSVALMSSAGRSTHCSTVIRDS